MRARGVTCTANSSRFSSVNVLWKRGQLYMRDHEEYVDCEVLFKHFTDKAILVSQNDEELWIPRSCLAWSSDTAVDGKFKRGDIVILRVAQWFAQKNNLDF